MTYLLRFLMAFWRRTLRLFDYPLPPFPGLLRVLDALFPFKLVLTGLGAEVKGLVLAMGVEPGLFFIYLHAAYRVLYHKNLHQNVFQAEDGIRVDLVTGVQTCALPILAMPPTWSSASKMITGSPCLASR